MVTGPRFLNTKLSCGWHSRDLQIEKDATDKDAKCNFKLFYIKLVIVSIPQLISLHIRFKIGKNRDEELEWHGGRGGGLGWKEEQILSTFLSRFLPSLFTPAMQAFTP